MAEWLYFATINTQIQRSRKRKLPQRSGIRMDNLNEIRIISCQPKRFGRIKLDQRFGWI